MENSIGCSEPEQFTAASNYLRVSLGELLSRMKYLIEWRKNCVVLLESAFRKRDLYYMIYACRYSAHFLFARGAIKAALLLLDRAMKLAEIDDKYHIDLIIADYRRYKNLI